jgi:hypothetical protein
MWVWVWVWVWVSDEWVDAGGSVGGSVCVCVCVCVCVTRKHMENKYDHTPKKKKTYLCEQVAQRADLRIWNGIHRSSCSMCTRFSTVCTCEK